MSLSSISSTPSSPENIDLDEDGIVEESNCDKKKPKPNIFEIDKKLKIGEYTLKKHTGKAPCWKKFSIICFNEKPIGFAQCDDCKKICTYAGHETGNSHLNRHACSKLVPEGQQKLSGFLKPSSQACALPKVYKSELKEAAIYFVSKDMRSFSTVQGPGFIRLTQKLVDTAVKIGRSFDVKQALPCCNTISAGVKDKAVIVKRQILDDVRISLEDVGCAFTSDLWQEDCRKIDYISLTVHYMNANFEMLSRVLETREFFEKKTGDNIRAMLDSLLASYDFSLDLVGKKCVFVTDRGSNMVKALRGLSHLNCVCHILNNILKDTFENKQPSLDFPNLHYESLELIDCCKEVVMYFKHSGLQKELKKGLRQPIDVRWNSRFYMLESIFDQYFEIESLLNQHNESLGAKFIADVDYQLLSELVKFLKPFEVYTKLLSGSNYPTICKVFPVFIRLRQYLQDISNNAYYATAILKKRASYFLNDKMKIDFIHKAATIFDPRLKNLTNLVNSAQKEEILDNLNKYMTDSAGMDDSPTVPKRLKPDSVENPFSLSALHDTTGATSTAANKFDELSTYLNTDILLDKYEIEINGEPELDLLKFWKEQQNLFPKLAKMARFFLAIPASSVASESDFSKAGWTINDRRTCLDPETVNSLMFLHSNLE